MARRTAFCFFIVVIFLFVCYLRVFSLTVSPQYSQAASQQNSYTLTVSELRGTIFDRSMHPITNNTYKIMAAVSPTPRAVTALRTVLDDGQMSQVLERLKSGKPIVCELPQSVDCDDIICVNVPVHTCAEKLAAQLIGYTDSAGHGVCGLEAAFDDYLYSEKGIEVRYAIDGHRNLLSGIDAILERNSSVTAGGVITTLDINIQSIVQRAAADLKKGAVVVGEVGTGKILALVSKPDYDPASPAAALDNPDSPFVNRALCAYNVGSIFKPCVAAAALENNTGTGFTHVCTGSTNIDGHTFYCHNRAGHGTVNLAQAIAKSCNTFFYNFSMAVGADHVYAMAKSLGFGNSITFANGISTTGDTIAGYENLKSSPRALANLAIGQGNLLISPVIMMNLYQAIAFDGTYTVPTLVTGTVANGKIENLPQTAPTRVMSEATAATLREYLRGVITAGTGGRAKPDNCTAAGKTATAETGWKNSNGASVEQAWFCGFFPFETPRYVVVVLAEDSVSGSESSAPLFKRIAEMITEYEGG